MGGFFSINLTKNAKKARGETFCTFAGITSLMLNSKLFNFITSRTPQNFEHGSYKIVKNMS